MAWKSTTGSKTDRLRTELKGRAIRQANLNARFEKLARERQRAHEVFERLQREYRDLRAAEMVGRRVTFTRDADSGRETTSGVVRDTWPGFAAIACDEAYEAIVVPLSDIPATSYLADSDEPETAELAVA